MTACLTYTDVLIVGAATFFLGVGVAFFLVASKVGGYKE